MLVRRGNGLRHGRVKWNQSKIRYGKGLIWFGSRLFGKVRKSTLKMWTFLSSSVGMRQSSTTIGVVYQDKREDIVYPFCLR